MQKAPRHTVREVGNGSIPIRSTRAIRVFEKMAESPAVSLHGQVFTKPHIVRLILDLVGYDSSADTASLRLLDPGCGNGAFIAEAAGRLLDVTPAKEIDRLQGSLLGIEKDVEAARASIERLVVMLVEHGVARTKARRIAEGWIRVGDFLLAEIEGRFDFVVGNPPYVRQEAIPKDLLAEYRQRYACFFDRADLYMGFIEHGLNLLNDHGVLGFICPNRFTRNRYGQKIRRLIAQEHQLRYAIDLSEASPFDQDVMAYPGIYIVGQGKTKSVRFVRLETASEEECGQAKVHLLSASEKPTATRGKVLCHDYDTWFDGESPWITESPEHMAILAQLEQEFPALGSEPSGCSVGIGVATGADAVFIVGEGFDQVEPELLMPLAVTKDCTQGRVEWSRICVINPFKGERTPELINLRDFPRAKRYFEAHSERLRGRNVAKRAGGSWYRTIDRIYPSLQKRAKLLIPDIKANNDIVYEGGSLYPHHNLYYVVSDYWDMHALRTILRSSVAKFFVWTYGVKMRGGWLRFQAQYLRRIRIPNVMTLNATDLQRLARLDREQDMAVVDAAVARIYGLSAKHLSLIQRTVSEPPDV